MFVKISEQPSLYNDLEKKSVREILEDINREDQKVALATKGNTSNRKTGDTDCSPHEAGRTYLLYGCRHKRTSWRT